MRFIRGEDGRGSGTLVLQAAVMKRSGRRTSVWHTGEFKHMAEYLQYTRQEGRKQCFGADFSSFNNWINVHQMIEVEQ